MVGLFQPEQFHNSQWTKRFPEENPAPHSSLGLRGLQVSPRWDISPGQQFWNFPAFLQCCHHLKPPKKGISSLLEAFGDSGIIMDLRLG